MLAFRRTQLPSPRETPPSRRRQSQRQASVHEPCAPDAHSVSAGIFDAYGGAPYPIPIEEEYEHASQFAAIRRQVVTSRPTSPSALLSSVADAECRSPATAIAGDRQGAY